MSEEVSAETVTSIRGYVRENALASMVDNNAVTYTFAFDTADAASAFSTELANNRTFGNANLSLSQDLDFFMVTVNPNESW
ncbi:MAG: hypothetical protein KIT31_31435 [Deltaproteobacteria bacterium]|nr:hypothetical protein [Deltaproteobacteria bacterium]